MEKELIAEIQEKYDQVDRKWLVLHHRTAIALFLLSVVVEGFLCKILSGFSVVNIGKTMFYLKYWVIPGAVNLLCILTQIGIMRAKRLRQKTKIYCISLTFVIICFVLFTVHIIFAALYLIFAIPIILTVVYADYRLTSVTALLCILSAAASELFIVWDPSKISMMESTIRMMDFLIAMFTLISFYGVCMVVILFERQKNADGILKDLEHRQLLKRLQTDELTGVYNRSALHDALKTMEMHADGQYIFVMLDLDHFKMINDTQGHLMGDRYLSALGGILTKNCTGGVPFRYGGDEFCILFPDSRMRQVLRICSQIQRDLKTVTDEEQVSYALTASSSIGGAWRSRNWCPTRTGLCMRQRRRETPFASTGSRMGRAAGRDRARCGNRQVRQPVSPLAKRRCRWIKTSEL